jgi:hypothetical protein
MVSDPFEEAALLRHLQVAGFRLGTSIIVGLDRGWGASSTGRYRTTGPGYSTTVLSIWGRSPEQAPLWSVRDRGAPSPRSDSQERH